MRAEAFRNTFFIVTYIIYHEKLLSNTFSNSVYRIFLFEIIMRGLGNFLARNARKCSVDVKKRRKMQKMQDAFFRSIYNHIKKKLKKHFAISVSVFN